MNLIKGTLLRIVVIAAVGVVTSGRAGAQALIWENQGLTDEQGISSGSSFSYNGATVTITWTTVTDGGTFTFYADGSGGPGNGSAGGGNNWLSYEESEEGGHTGLLLLGIDNSSFDPDDYLQVTLTFSQPQSLLAFSLLDIDATSWDDGLALFYNGANNVRADTSLWSYGAASGRSVVTDDEPGYTGWEGINGIRADPDENIGNIDLNFEGIAINNLTLRFFSTNDEQGSGSNPGGQKIGFSDFAVVPEPETYLAGVLLLVAGVILHWRRWRRARCLRV